MNAAAGGDLVTRHGLQTVLAAARWLGRVYGALGQLYFGAGTVMALIQLAAFFRGPSWHAVADAASNAAFGFFLWPMVLMSAANN